MELDLTIQQLREYELVMILSPEASDDEITASIERWANYITERGGSVSEQDVWGLRRLAYPIKRFVEGNYVLTRFEMDTALIKELDRTMNASEDVLRHLVTMAVPSAQKKAPNAETPPSAEAPPDTETPPNAEAPPSAEAPPDTETPPNAEASPNAETPPDTVNTPDAENES